MALKTWLTETLGIRYPIVQGAMQWLSTAEFAAAVANAGGLGIITAASCFSAAELRREIRKVQSLTDKPFAVNFTIMPTRRKIVWEQYLNAALEEGISIVETSGRSPEPYMEWLKAAGVTVLHKAARVRDARTAERVGVDAVTIIGYESGGHPGLEDVTSLVLLPRTVDAVRIPVIAGGGFADGRGLAAALALGAQGIAMGTRFMATRECPLHPKIKALLRQKMETETLLLERSFRNTARVLKTDFSQRVLDMEEAGATLEELITMLDGQRVRKSFLSTGDAGDAIIYCGQSVGLIDDEPTVKDLMDRIVSQAEEIIKRIGGGYK